MSRESSAGASPVEELQEHASSDFVLLPGTVLMLPYILTKRHSRIALARYGCMHKESTPGQRASRVFH
eukprot:1158995-Pelagomonas_calceolata.AAC.4